MDASLEFEGLPAFLESGNAASIIKEEAMQAVAESASVLQATMKESSPVASSAMQESWLAFGPTEANGNISGGTVTSRSYALVLDKGAKPHFPPVGEGDDVPALGPWIKQQFGLNNPTDIKRLSFLIGRKIARRGFPAKQIFTNAFNGLTGTLQTIHNNMIDRIIQRAQ